MEWTVRRTGIGRLPGRRMVALKSDSSSKPFKGITASRILFGVTASNRAPASFARTKSHPQARKCRVNPTLYRRPLMRDYSRLFGGVNRSPPNLIVFLS